MRKSAKERESKSNGVKDSLEKSQLGNTIIHEESSGEFNGR